MKKMNTNNKPYIKTATIILFTVVFVFLLISLTRTDKANEYRGKKEIPTQTTFLKPAIASQGKTIKASGILEPIDNATISSKTSGPISYLYYNAGDKVGRGDVIAVIEHDRLLRELSLANAEYEKAKAELSNQITLYESIREKSQVEVEKVSTTKNSTEYDLSNQLEDAKRLAYDNAQQSFSDAISGIIVLSDFQKQSSKNRPYSSSGNIAMSSLQQSADILLGADSEQSRWDSQFLIQLSGGVKEMLDNMDRNFIENDALNKTLSDLQKALGHILTGLTEIRASAMSYESQEKQDEVNNTITTVNSAISRISRSQDKIGSILVSISNSEKEQSILEKQAEVSFRFSSKQYEDAVKVAEQAVELSKQKINLIKAKIKEAFVYSPFDGTITELFVSLGESVSAGSEIVTIASGGGWKTTLMISEVFNEQLKTGNDVKFKISGISEEFESKITRIIPSIDKYSKRIKVEVYIDDLPDTARAGMVVQAEISTNQSKTDKTEQTIFAIPNRFIGYGYDGTYIENVSGEIIPIKILSRQKDESIIEIEDFTEETEIRIPT